nr:immunoglobulin heavy chain junction region [Mus musculus]MBK4196285.1 immunoglobulin heavy chain junction region [Mus musculus]
CASLYYSNYVEFAYW